MLSSLGMGDARALEAIARIERALARLEAAAIRPSPAAPAAAPEPSDEFERLREAHDALRQRVAGAIGQIDELLEGRERR